MHEIRIIYAALMDAIRVSDSDPVRTTNSLKSASITSVNGGLRTRKMRAIEPRP